MVYLTRTAGLVQSGGVDGELHLESRPEGPFKTNPTPRAAYGHQSMVAEQEDKDWQRGSSSLLLSHKYCYRKLPPGTWNLSKRTRKHSHQHLPPAMSIHTAVLISLSQLQLSCTYRKLRGTCGNGWRMFFFFLKQTADCQQNRVCVCKYPLGTVLHTIICHLLQLLSLCKASKLKIYIFILISD